MCRSLLLLLLLLFPLPLRAAAGASPDSGKVPIVYSPRYDVTLFGIERLQHFDSRKYGKVYRYLRAAEGLPADAFYTPEKASAEDLLSVHTKQYLDSLRRSRTVAFIAGLDILAYLPNFILQNKLLVPMQYATGGTVLGARLALQYGWAINLAGGYHHAKSHFGGGLCFYADVPLAVKKLQKEHPGLPVLIVDLDAHQGNGNAELFRGDPNVHIFDVYNGTVYPWDFEARTYAEFNYPLASGVGDRELLALVGKELPKAIEKVRPGLIVFVAGTDGIKDDSLGRWALSEDGILQRDALVFRNALKYKVPILMVLSGGYTEHSASIIGKSITNVMDNIIRYRERPDK